LLICPFQLSKAEGFLFLCQWSQGLDELEQLLLFLCQWSQGLDELEQLILFLCQWLYSVVCFILMLLMFWNLLKLLDYLDILTLVLFYF
jgi:hypothetical protein